MPSTYSNLKIQLMATGENTTTWGNVTNVNLGTALEEAIAGSADVTFASNNQTLTLTDTNATQTARNMRLRCTGTTGGSTRDLVVPTIEKPYIVQNDCADSVVVKTSAGTGITVPAGKTMWVYADGTNVVDVATHLTSLTLGTALAVAQGAVGTPSYTFTGDLNTGMWSPAADTVAVSTAGSERMRIDSAGNVGIGTSSPASKLDVNGDVTITDKIIHSGDPNTAIRFPSTDNFTVETAGSERMRITEAGNVGIGTNSPSAKLHVIGAIRSTVSCIVTGAGSMKIALAGDGLALDSSNNIAFETADSERMRINSAGRVGIGTATPASILDVNGDVTITDKIIHSGDTNTAIRFPSADTFTVETNGSERMRVNSAGSVGIGTSTVDAAALLEVNSTTLGFMPPRMTTAQRDAIAGGAPPDGLILYNIQAEKLQVYSDGLWRNLH